MTKLRSDSSLAALTTEQRDQLFDWLARNSYADVIALAARPLADGGFDIKFHRNTLLRFREGEAAERRTKHFAELAATSMPGGLPPDFIQHMTAIKARYAEATYNLSKAAGDPDNYDRLQRAVIHFDQCAFKVRELEQEQQRIELSRERLAEEKRQFEFNAAREALKRRIELNNIADDPQLDNEDKIWKSRQVCFGVAAPLISNSTSQLDNLEPDNLQPRPQDASTQIHPLPDKTLAPSFPSLASVNEQLEPGNSSLEPLKSTQIHAPWDNNPGGQHFHSA